MARKKRGFFKAVGDFLGGLFRGTPEPAPRPAARPPQAPQEAPRPAPRPTRAPKPRGFLTRLGESLGLIEKPRARKPRRIRKPDQPLEQARKKRRKKTSEEGKPDGGPAPKTPKRPEAPPADIWKGEEFAFLSATDPTRVELEIWESARASIEAGQTEFKIHLSNFDAASLERTSETATIQVPEGAGFSEFIKAINAARRDFMEKVGSDGTITLLGISAA